MTRRSISRRLHKQSRKSRRQSGGGFKASYKKYCTSLKTNKLLLDGTIKLAKANKEKAVIKRLKRSLVKAGNLVCTKSAADKSLVSTAKRAQLAKTANDVAYAATRGHVTGLAAADIVARTRNLMNTSSADKIGHKKLDSYLVKKSGANSWDVKSDRQRYYANTDQRRKAEIERRFPERTTSFKGFVAPKPLEFL